MPDFVENDASYIVPFEDTKTMAEKVVYLCANPEEEFDWATARCKPGASMFNCGGRNLRIIDQCSVKQDVTGS
jgi:hypothetical protein